MPDEASRIAPLELFRLEEIPEAGSKELIRISKERKGLQTNALAGMAISLFIILLILTSGITIDFLIILVVMAAAFAIPAMKDFCTLCFGPKAWQLLPSGSSIASATLEESVHREAAAWNLEAGAWNSAFASWVSDAEAWSDRKGSSGFAQDLRERLNRLYHDRKALMHRRRTLEMQLMHLQKLLSPASQKSQARLPERSVISKDP